jgi:ATP-binding cassette subfamily F protein uup
VVIVSHDRFLLDNVTTRMLELDRGNAFIHNQGYADYLDAKAERAERAQDADTVRRNLARRELAWLRRGAKARTRKPQARIAAARALIETRPEAPERASAMELEFPTPRLGNTVIELEDVTVGYGTESGPVIKGLTLRLDPQERLGIVGTNGSGKSTLLSTIAGELRPLQGSRIEGTTVVIGHYTQRSREVPANIRVREVVAGPHGNPNDLTVQRLLERFWFTGELPYATVGTLSGGERRRLQLLEVLAQQPNVLLLDEPTNDLDLDTLRTLEEFLEAWPGALVVVSHDRAFLDRVTSRLLACDHGSAEEVPGGLSTWLERLRSAPAGPASTPTRTSPESSGASKAQAALPTRTKSESTLGFQMRELEKTMERLRKQERSLVQRFEQAADHHALIELGHELAEVQTQLSSAEESWLEIAEEAEQVRAARRT